MKVPIPGLDEALSKLNEASAKMDVMVDKFDRVIQLLEEQNSYICPEDNEMLYKDALEAFKNEKG